MYNVLAYRKTLTPVELTIDGVMTTPNHIQYDLLLSDNDNNKFVLKLDSMPYVDKGLEWNSTKTLHPVASDTVFTNVSVSPMTVDIETGMGVCDGKEVMIFEVFKNTYYADENLYYHQFKVLGLYVTTEKIAGRDPEDDEIMALTYIPTNYRTEVTISFQDMHGYDYRAFYEFNDYEEVKESEMTVFMGAKPLIFTHVPKEEMLVAIRAEYGALNIHDTPSIKRYVNGVIADEVISFSDVNGKEDFKVNYDLFQVNKL